MPGHRVLHVSVAVADQSVELAPPVTLAVRLLFTLSVPVFPMILTLRP